MTRLRSMEMYFNHIKAYKVDVVNMNARNLAKVPNHNSQISITFPIKNLYLFCFIINNPFEVQNLVQKLVYMNIICICCMPYNPSTTFFRLHIRRGSSLVPMITAACVNSFFIFVGAEVWSHNRLGLNSTSETLMRNTK